MSDNKSATVVGLVDELLIKEAKNNDRNYKVFHASEWDKCQRKIAYAYYESHGLIKTNNTAWKIDPKGQRIFGNGHYMHDRWGTYFKKLGIMRGRWLCENWTAHEKPKIYGEHGTLGVLCPNECECGSNRFKYLEISFFDEETNWGGSVDAIITTERLKGNYPKLILVDFKTMNPFEFKKLKEPKPEHITQVQIYLHLTGLTVGKVMYENKAYQDVKEFDLHKDDAFLAVKKQEARLLKHRVTHRNSHGQLVLPQRGYMSPGNWDCSGCKFRAHCWKSCKK